MSDLVGVVGTLQDAADRILGQEDVQSQRWETQCFQKLHIEGAGHELLLKGGKDVDVRPSVNEGGVSGEESLR